MMRWPCDSATSDHHGTPRLRGVLRTRHRGAGDQRRLTPCPVHGVRRQMDTITRAGVFDGYLLSIDNSPALARIDRLEHGAFAFSTPFTLNPSLNTTDTFRLRLRATGINPVVLNAYVERLVGTTWMVI